MKYFLYFSLLPFLNTIAGFIEDEINLLEAMYSSDNHTLVDGMDKYSAFAFDESTALSIKFKEISSIDETLSSPFILKAIFKLDETKTSCLFSIVKDSTVKIGLCIRPIADDAMKIIFELEGLPPKMDGRLDYTGNLQDWIKMILYVEQDQVTLFVNCVHVGAAENNVVLEDVQITGDSVLNLGHYGNGYRFFEGIIQELKFYKAINTIEKLDIIKSCSAVPIFPDSDSPPEELTIFTEDSGTVKEIPVKGEKGEKGDPGTSVKGDVGPPGPEGPPGSPGKKGADGTCSCSESVVSSLLKKMPEMRGPPGAQGPRGETGDPGKTGLTGKPGEQGERGPSGLKGEMGVRGRDGLPGKDGERGEKGDLGSDGLMGPPGPQGPMGPPGPPGPKCKETEAAKVVATPGDKGEPGLTGLPGPVGPQGRPGEKGDRGDKGDVGENGPQGYPGREGPRGEKGDRGHPGADGIPGEPGVHGRPAEKGVKGDKGETGERGVPGLPAKLSSLLDPKDAEENAEIIEKLKGPKGDIGPRGERGEKGETGPIGPIGPPGKDGHHGHPGVQGTRGKEGPIGPIGPVGPKGEPGEPGPPGGGSVSSAVAIKGSKGDKGQRGKDGSRGPVGKTGKPGSTGKRGPKGDTGAQGLIGPPGTCKDDKGGTVTVKGEKGDRGNDGKPGEKGSPGIQGQCPMSCNSSVGPPGPPGVPGRPGLQGPPGVRGLKGEPGNSFAEKIYAYINDGVDGDPSEDQKYRDEDDEVYSTNTVIYRTKRALIKHTSSTPLGTLAYVLRENIFLLRNKNGWQYVVMGSILPMENNYRSTSTTYRPPLLNFESSTPPTSVQSTAHSRPPRTYRTSIRLAALNEPYPGNMLTQTGMFGIKAANEACRRDSRKAGLKGTFVAFLANSNQYLRYLVGQEDEHLPVVNLFDQVLFDHWIDMFNGTEAVLPENVNIYGFNHKNTFMDTSWPEQIIWHGGYANGSLAKDLSCNNWEKSEAVGLASKIRINNRNNKLLGQEKYSCDNKFIVLCVESIARRSRHSESRYRDHLNHYNPIPQS